MGQEKGLIVNVNVDCPPSSLVDAVAFRIRIVQSKKRSEELGIVHTDFLKLCVIHSFSPLLLLWLACTPHSFGLVFAYRQRTPSYQLTIAGLLPKCIPPCRPSVLFAFPKPELRPFVFRSSLVC